MPEAIDLTNCDREPIHIPGSIQPHGALLVTDSFGTIIQVSENVRERLGLTASDLLGQSSKVILEGRPDTFASKELHYDVSYRRLSQGEAIEFEPRHRTGEPSMHLLVQAATQRLHEKLNARDLCDEVVKSIGLICEFDRVMVYRFLPDGTGSVIAEKVKSPLEPYLGLFYPATDIPKQARELYLRNPIRLISDVNYRPCPMMALDVPAARETVDMSDVALRSVSPIHIQYLKNMGVSASMSISLIVDGKLWGLIACHHDTPWYGSKQMRQGCEYIAQVASLKIALTESRQYERSLKQSRGMFAQLTQEILQAVTIAEALANNQGDLLQMVGASGAAIVNSQGSKLFGITPSEQDVQQIVEIVKDHCDGEPYAINSLASKMPGAERYSKTVSGVLAMCYLRGSSNYILWFRPEFIETIIWGGRPEKIENAADPSGGLHPRESFAAWQQEVRLHCRPWTEANIAIAAELRIAVLEAELLSLNNQLEAKVNDRTLALQKAVDELQGFTYSVSHDLRTPLRGMVGNSRILLDEYGSQVPKGARDRLQAIENNALKMAALVDDLLSYARLGGKEMTRVSVDVSRIVGEVAKSLITRDGTLDESNFEIQAGMTATGDVEQIQILFTILMENGCLYRHKDEMPLIEVGQLKGVFSVRNTGIGFDNQYLPKLFRPFERLHRDGDYPGTGIGLANAKRIVDRHHGEIWGDGQLGVGATFYFTLSNLSASPM